MKLSYKTKDLLGVIGILIGLALVTIAPFSAWVTHVITTIQHEQWGLLLIGAIAFPIGIIHGTGIWFGLF